MALIVSKRIFEQGLAAKAEGLPYLDDPYRAGSQDSADWLAGYTADEERPEGSGPGDGGVRFAMSGSAPELTRMS